MTPTVKNAHHTSDYRVWITFSDGTSGEVDLESELWGPMFEPLRDPALFAQVHADPELDTITWPNGADLAPEYLYELVQTQQPQVHGRTGEPCPESGVWMVKDLSETVFLTRGNVFPPHLGRAVEWRMLERVGD